MPKLQEEEVKSPFELSTFTSLRSSSRAVAARFPTNHERVNCGVFNSLTYSTNMFATDGERNKLQIESVANQNRALNSGSTTVEENNKVMPAQPADRVNKVENELFIPTDSKCEASVSNEMRDGHFGRKQAKSQYHQDKLN